MCLNVFLLCLCQCLVKARRTQKLEILMYFKRETRKKKSLPKDEPRYKETGSLIRQRRTGLARLVLWGCLLAPFPGENANVFLFFSQ